ncbi:MAG: dihydrolipoyl dehydrogenase [Phycisphaerae bacterium]|nr:dihydrolipoyl dehydrogenase [Phycisphaerae bacterium]
MSTDRLSRQAEVVVIGGGPGGYVAAIRAADLGKKVVLIEERDRLGGVCLLEGCIPSKTLIHAVEVADAARHAKKMGLSFADLQIDPEVLRGWKEQVVDDLTKGIAGLLKRRGVEVLKARARFKDNATLLLEGCDIAELGFDDCIIATGSRVKDLPGVSGEGVWTSTEALRMSEVPSRLLVVGGGYIGMELGMVYAGLGSEVTVVEFMPSILITADKDMVSVVARSCRKKFAGILLDSKVVELKKTPGGFAVAIEKNGKTTRHEFDRVLVAVGRQPNTDNLGLESTAIKPNAQGLIETDDQCRTVEPNIFAIGDATPGIALAHKASREGKVAAEVIAGCQVAFGNAIVPAVVFTDPEIAWTGLNELQAKEEGIEYTVGKFPLAALGRARAIGRTEGFAKVLCDPSSGALLGVGMVGPHASELIAGPTLALELGATLENLMNTIHPHPTLSESIMEAAEAAAGSAVHLNPPRKR